VAERLVASQEELSSMEFVGFYSNCLLTCEISCALFSYVYIHAQISVINTYVLGTFRTTPAWTYYSTEWGQSIALFHFM
jgi:hypothetical protein